MNVQTRARIVGLVLAAAVAPPVLAADAAPAASGDPQTDAIVRKLEQSGALDAAVDRAINRYVQRKDAEQQGEQARRDAEGAKRARPCAGSRGSAGLSDGHSVDKLASALGIKTSSFSGCMTDAKGAVAVRVDEDVSDGTAAGISGTPATVVRNNKTGASQAVVGALPPEAFTAVIDRMLDAKP